MLLHPQQWVVNAIAAQQLIAEGATVLDVRNRLAYMCGHAPGAVRVTWQEFSQQKPPNKGKLLDEREVLEQKLRQLGISNDIPIIVVGNPQQPWHFGEEGRIVWMLHTLGHLQAAFVDGGQPALVKAGVRSVWGISKAIAGDFRIQRTKAWEIDSDELKNSLSTQKLITIDTRESREYAGATPYGEKQGGHIPGAIHFYFKDLLDDNGCLLPAREIALKLEQLGISSDSAIAAYCTGGIRSAFVVAVLVNLGFTNVRNYPGSMWEWSQANYPLTKEP